MWICQRRKVLRFCLPQSECLSRCLSRNKCSSPFFIPDLSCWVMLFASPLPRNSTSLDGKQDGGHQVDRLTPVAIDKPLLFAQHKTCGDCGGMERLLSRSWSDLGLDDEFYRLTWWNHIICLFSVILWYIIHYSRSCSFKDEFCLSANEQDPICPATAQINTVRAGCRHGTSQHWWLMTRTEIGAATGPVFSCFMFQIVWYETVPDCSPFVTAITLKES